MTSAFGTVGLSMGLTPELTAFGKLLLILLMFTGRLGAFTLAYALQPKKKRNCSIIRRKNHYRLTSRRMIRYPFGNDRGAFG